MEDRLAALAFRREAMGFPPLPESELITVLKMLDDITTGLATMPEVSAIDPAVRFAAISAPADEGEQQ